MIPAYGARSYAQTQIQSATPLQLIALLYDRAVQSTLTARDAMSRGDIPTRRAAVNKVLEIIAELQNTLDPERGGAVAVELERIYMYIVKRLLDAVQTQTCEPLDEVHGILGTLRDAWQKIAYQTPGSAGDTP